MHTHRPRKRFGQHFLHDANVIQRIITAVAPAPGDLLVEIGPGLGAITVPLLKACGRLHVVEIDRDVIPELKNKCAGGGELIVHNKDALQFNFTDLADGNLLRLTGNLPYNISTPLLFHLLQFSHLLRDMHFMLQREVVDRMCAKENDAAYGRLSVMLACACEVHSLFNIGKDAFSPPPKVESAFVRLVPHAEPPFLIRDKRRFSAVVAQAFSKRRKTVRNALKGLVDESVYEECGINPQLRPENLAPSQFAQLANMTADTGQIE